MNREEALDVALGQIERQFGKGSVMKMSEGAQVAVGAVSTGSLSLDLALGIGGLPRGRVVEIYGPESSGKTTLVYHVIAEAQRRGGICAFIDAEHAMDPQYARRIGVNVDELLVSQPDTGEQALEITELLIRSGALDVVAVDSVAALTPKAEIEGEMGDSHVGLQARLMSQALRKLAGTLNRTDTICLFTNQLREKIGVMFGSPETTPGGRALKFYASVRLDIRRIETLKDGAEAFGNRVRVKVVKNKVAPPFKQAEFDIIYGTGISWEGTVLDVGIERKIVQKSGSYFSFGDERLGQGRQNAAAFLREHPDVVQQVLARIQADAPAEQTVSARLLPTVAEAERPVEADPVGPTRWSSRRPCRRRRDARQPVAERDEPLEIALRALRLRDRSAAEVAERLQRRGVAGVERSQVLQRLESAGYLDDGRFARQRAAELAARGAGNALIRNDLEQRGIERELVEAALEALEPERARALRTVERRGRSARTARYLAARGFGEDALTGLVAEEE
jgi:recombination protein RecA